MTIKHSLLCLLTCGLLAACATRGTRNGAAGDTEVDQQILEAAQKIQSAQNQLFKSAALSRPINQVAATIRDGDQRVTLTWKGDAQQLLMRMAKDRGLNFTQMGIRMPLPVVINVHDEPFAEVLEQIRAQVGYRAVVDEARGSLVLLYNRPQS
jgi:defect-in-organelle-trafficking protein DotD